MPSRTITPRRRQQRPPRPGPAQPAERLCHRRPGPQPPPEIGPGHGTIHTGNNILAYTGGSISGNGVLSFIGTPFTLGSDLS